MRTVEAAAIALPGCRAAQEIYLAAFLAFLSALFSFMVLAGAFLVSFLVLRSFAIGSGLGFETAL